MRRAPGANSSFKAPTDADTRIVYPALSVQTLTFQGSSTVSGSGSGGSTASAACSRAHVRRPRQALLHPSAPPPVPGRQNCDCQTDPAVLEALKVPRDVSASTQTDGSLPKESTPAEAPAPPPGIAAGTQVTEGELFDFERDAVPAVELLVGHALQQAALEAAEELQLEELRRKRRALEEAQYREQQAVLRLQVDAERRAAEQARRQREAEELALLKTQQVYDLLPLEFLQQAVEGMTLPLLGKLAAQQLQEACC